MQAPSEIAFIYGDRSPTIQDIVTAAELYVPGTTWIADVQELAITNTTVPSRLQWTEWPSLSSGELVELLIACPPMVESGFEGFGEFRNAYWLQLSVRDGNVLAVNSAQHGFIQRLRETFVPVDDQ